MDRGVLNYYEYRGIPFSPKEISGDGKLSNEEDGHMDLDDLMIGLDNIQWIWCWKMKKLMKRMTAHWMEMGLSIMGLGLSIMGLVN